MTEPRPASRIDPMLVALVAAQRLVPIGVLAIYVRGYRSQWFVAAGIVAWTITMLQAIRTATVARTARKQAVSDAAFGIARSSAARMRGGAHDALLEIIWRGIGARASLATETVPSLIASFVALPVAFAVAISIDGRDAALATMLAGAVGVAVRIPLARAHQARIQELHAALSVLARDFGHGLRALEDLQAHGLADAYARRLEGHADRLATTDAAANRAGRAAMLGPLVAGSMVFVAVLHRTIEQPTVGLIHLATLLVLGPIAIGLARGIVQRTRQSAEATALDALGVSAPELTVPSAPVSVGVVAPIEWRHVTFAHRPTLTLDRSNLTEPSAPASTAHPTALVFDDVTLRWDGRGPLAIVGPNGSGKSTLVLLLLRLVDPTVGTVSIGGVDLRQADLSTLRPRIAYVPQRPLLLEGMSVAEAMRLVAPDRDDAQLLAALERVGLAQRLTQRGGAPLAVRCSSLSVGEAQRVAIARALVREAELLVLDEPEAGLDPAGRTELRVLLESLSAEGKLVVLASQHEDVVPAGAQRMNLPLAKGEQWPPRSE